MHDLCGNVSAGSSSPMYPPNGSVIPNTWTPPATASCPTCGKCPTCGSYKVVPYPTPYITC